ncbi:MAG: hypothetical protein AB1714_22145 [Acidobacteriota bacterium]
MKRRILSIPTVGAVLLLFFAQHASANEMQRLVFNAAGNIGVAMTIIEIQGVTPENSERISSSINLAVTQLNQIAGMHPDPPFEVDAITALPPKLLETYRSEQAAAVTLTRSAGRNHKLTK